MIVKEQEQFDPRIGLYEEYNVQVCAKSGQSIDGHSTTKRILGNYHFRVLNKFNLGSEEMKAIQKELLNLIPKEEITRIREVQRALLTKIENDNTRAVRKSAKKQEVDNDK